MRVPLYNGTGGMSIMQRESSAGSHISTTGLSMRSVTSSALLPTPMESEGQHQPPSSLPQVHQEVVYQQGLLYKHRGREDIVIDHVLAVSISLMEGILRIYSLRLVILSMIRVRREVR